MSAVSNPDTDHIHQLLSRAVSSRVLSSREAAQMRAGLWLDEEGVVNMPCDMERQMAKLFMMEVVPANHRPL